MIDAMKQALEALEMFCEYGTIDRPFERRNALYDAIEQAEKQEPVAWISEPMVAAVRRANPDWYGKWQAELTCTQMFPHQIPLYTATVKREWRGLTASEALACHRQSYDAQIGLLPSTFYRAIEAKLKEKNT